MLTEEAVFCSATPISSAIAMNRLLNTSSMTGSASVPTRGRRARGDGAGEDEVAERVDRRRPAGLDDGGGGGVDDERRAGDTRRRVQSAARSMNLARLGGKCRSAAAAVAGTAPRSTRSSDGTTRPSPRPDRFDDRGLDDDRRVGERSRSGCGASARTPARMSGADRHFERRVAAFVAERGAAADFDARSTPCARSAASASVGQLAPAPPPDRRRRACAAAARPSRRGPCRRRRARRRADGSSRVSMPSASATRQACWPPAPPKHCSV